MSVFYPVNCPGGSCNLRAGYPGPGEASDGGRQEGHHAGKAIRKVVPRPGALEKSIDPL